MWNLLDCSAAVLAPTLIIMDTVFNVDPSVLKPIAAVAVLIFYLKLFYFMRIFDSAS